jgi:hypothetical protein
VRNTFGVDVATLTPQALAVCAGSAVSSRDQAPHAQEQERDREERAVDEQQAFPANEQAVAGPASGSPW